MLLTIPLMLLAAFLSLFVAYYLLLFCANAFIADPPDFRASRTRRFNVVVPAHNEELFLPRLLKSLKGQSYRPDCFHTTVVADNCTDGTAVVGGSFAVEVLERFDQVNRGKGYAIRWAVQRIEPGRFDALVIVDSDSTVAPDFLAELNLQMERGDDVIQCWNGIANPCDSWFTRLLDVSRTIGNEIIHPGKRKLGLSSYLMGNGMCFNLPLIDSQGWDAFSVGEDWEYYAKLVLAGRHVGYSRRARVYHQESVGLAQASPQRLRWSSGRFQILRKYGLSLILNGLRKRDIACVDASLPLIFPNPSLGVNLTLFGMAAALTYHFFGGSSTLSVWFLALLLVQVLMFVVGILHTKYKTAAALSFFFAPVFLVWKLAIDVLSFCGIGTKEWKRTDRRH